DPVCALAVRLHIAPGGKAQLTFATAVAPDAGSLQALVDRYRQSGPVQRASLMSATLSGIRLRTLGLAPEPLAALQSLSTALLYTLTRSAPGNPSGRCDKRLLWRFGLSGDRPLVLVQASTLQGLGLVRTLAQALRLWAWGGLACDLVLLNSEPASYLMPLHQALVALRDRLQADLRADLLADRQADQRGETGAARAEPVGNVAGLHLLRPDELSPDELATLRAVARVRLDADGRPLAHPVQAWLAAHELALQERQDMACTALPAAPAPAMAPAVPQGHFDATTGAFGFAVWPDQRPQRPWTQVLANPDFGSLLTEAGGGYTWAGNSRLHQVTGWSNDPLRDPPAEWLLLHDLDTRRVWPLGQALLNGSPRTLTHGLGFSRSTQRLDGLDITLTWCVDVHQAVKQLQLEIHQGAGRPRRLRLVAVAEWQMGGQRSERLSVITRAQWFRPEPAGAGLPTPAATRVLQATQADHLGGQGEATAFLAWRPPQPGETSAPAQHQPDHEP
ncbi:MAG: hypothetical protein CFE45_25010, partial [Burkholderiales bacterium PBB5]